ncbi:SipW-dependent-type signal peptide-containing protein [Hoyosella altamirensis]|uniref:Putative ribosomally synthesized peptide with SipW-like signal peptide n=1 Tax=Hoyosella altamirensis TaxID=616997 RepID=A0A839RRH3_9ACTN|nr:SipW-dependent-type signal peptide-containing protein [Hoyosella altamirensis]MBB3039130.1 putative ribosomally synthesized peptide with SipW-like signal peptide [Hoyosella altamirensis]
MTTTAPVTPRDTSDRKRKIRAILAGGVVLGIGAAITLAAWNDSVWAEGQFATDAWNVQGSTDGGSTWFEYATSAEAGQLQFTLDNLAMVPGDTVYAPFALRVGPDTSTLDASVILNGAIVANTNPFVSDLQLTVTGANFANCNDGTAGAALTGWPSSAPLGAGGATPITVNGDGTQYNLCFVVHLPNGSGPYTGGQQETGSVLWKFDAESA